MIVEELVTKLGLEISSDAVSTLEKFKQLVTGALTDIRVVAAAAAAALTGVTVSALNAADEMGDLAEKLGVNAKALQELRVAALLSDTSFDALSMGLKFLQKNAAEAAAGSTEAAEAFAGINFRDSNGQIKAADELLTDVAARFEEVKNPAEQTRLAMKIFGRQGAELLPMLRKGASGIAAYRKEAEELGVVFGDEALAAGDDFGRSMTRANLALEGLRNTVARPFMRGFATLAEKVAKGFVLVRKAIEAVGEKLKEWDENGLFEPIYQLAKLALPGLALAFTFVGIQATLAAVKTVAAWLLAAAPFILLGLLIGILVDEIYNFIEGNDSLLGRIIKWSEAFDPSGNPVIEFFKSAIALLFDFTDPKKWERLVTMFNNLSAAIGEVMIRTFQFVGAKLTEILGSAINAFLEKFPIVKKLLGAQVSALGAGANALGLGGYFDAARDTAANALGLSGPKPSEQAKTALFDAAGRLNPFSGGASGPDAAGEISASGKKTGGTTVKQTNNVTINGTNLSEDQLKRAVADGIADQNKQTFAAMGGG